MKKAVSRHVGTGMSLQFHRDTDIFNFVSPLGKKFPLQRAGRFPFATPTLHSG